MITPHTMSQTTSLLIPELADFLPSTPLFQCDYHLSLREQAVLAYKRARAIARKYALNSDDILNLTEKFWALHMDNIVVLDGAATTLLSIQYNLAAGTLARFAMKRRELRPMVQKLLKFEVSGQFLLTEISHGLDAFNIETTATLLPTGEFDLHTPNSGAAKYMPPTGPFADIPRVGIVFARLVVGSENRGIRPFLVALGDRSQMCEGVTCRILPIRAGSKPVLHALTYFKHVRLPSGALLGHLTMPANLHFNFLASIWRVTIGTLALSTLAVPSLAISTYVAAKYSMRRTITDSVGQAKPLWSFRTQQLPILHALSQVYVMRAYATDAIRLFKDDSLDIRVRMGIASAVKAVMTTQSQASLILLSERCGAQGLFEHNQIISIQMQMRGVAIAEGDTLVLSIRLAMELLLGRYEMPAPRYPNSLLSRHETAMMKDCRSHISKLGSHRSDEVNRLILPLCQPLVEIIGSRMGYEAAIDAKVPQHFLDLYQVAAIKRNAAWFAEHASLGFWEVNELEEQAASVAVASFEHDLEALDLEPYAVAPIITQSRWDEFAETLEFYKGNAHVDLGLVDETSPRSRL